MATAECYYLIYDTDTSAFEKHGTDTITSSVDTITSGSSSVDIISATCSLGHILLISADGGSSIEDTNLSADFAVTSGAENLTSAINTTDELTSVTPSINTNITGDILQMKVTLTIILKNPIITASYTSTKTKPTNVVKKA